MTRPKILSAPLLVFLDFHVGVAKGHALYPVAVRNVHHRLFLAVAGFALCNPARLVQCDALAFVFCHYIPSSFSLRPAAMPVNPIAPSMLADKFRKLRNSGSKRANSERIFFVSIVILTSDGSLAFLCNS